MQPWWYLRLAIPQKVSTDKKNARKLPFQLGKVVFLIAYLLNNYNLLDAKLLF